MKRFFDVLVAATLLLLTAPVMAAIAVAQMLEGQVPVFWSSPRVGRRGRTFDLIGFQTMVDGGPDASPTARLTAVGGVIRNYSLDHLPMLFNVLRGDLSIVGPRPMEPSCIDPNDPGWQRLLSVRPGMVSYAILRLGRRYNASSMAEKQRLELEYVRRQSLRTDLNVFVEAVCALVASSGNVKARGQPRV